MTAQPIPRRHWRSYGSDPLPSGTETLDEPFSAFQSWFLRVTCDRCGKVHMVNQAHQLWDDMLMRDIIAKMRHDGYGGRPGPVEGSLHDLFETARQAGESLGTVGPLSDAPVGSRSRPTRCEVSIRFWPSGADCLSARSPTDFPDSPLSTRS